MAKKNKDGLEGGSFVSTQDHAKVLLKHRKEAPIVDPQAEVIEKLTKALGLKSEDPEAKEPKV